MTDTISPSHAIRSANECDATELARLVNRLRGDFAFFDEQLKDFVLPIVKQPLSVDS
jgi:hypothetical protein